MRSRDLDILVVVNRLADVKEKKLLELEITRSLRSIELRKPVDVIVLDTEMFEENAKPGGIVSGLIMGYKIVYDEVGIPSIVEEVVHEASKEEGYTVIKENKKLGLYALAKIKAATK